MKPRTAAYAVALLVGVSGPAQSPVITALAPLVPTTNSICSVQRSPEASGCWLNSRGIQLRDVTALCSVER